MSRKKKPTAEIELVRKPDVIDVKAAIDRMVRERLDEILGASRTDELLDCQPRAISDAARADRNAYEGKKWGLYFEDYGCRVCGRKDCIHAGTGHCATCRGRLQMRLAHVRRKYELTHPELEIDRKIDQLTSKFRTAKALLGSGDE